LSGCNRWKRQAEGWNGARCGQRRRGGGKRARIAHGGVRNWKDIEEASEVDLTELKRTLRSFTAEKRKPSKPRRSYRSQLAIGGLDRQKIYHRGLQFLDLNFRKQHRFDEGRRQVEWRRR